MGILQDRGSNPAPRKMRNLRAAAKTPGEWSKPEEDEGNGSRFRRRCHGLIIRHGAYQARGRSVSGGYERLSASRASRTRVVHDHPDEVGTSNVEARGDASA